MVYEGIGYMISTEQYRQQQYIQQLMQYTHKDWQDILKNAGHNMMTLNTPETIKQLIHIIKINQRVAFSVGQ